MNNFLTFNQEKCNEPNLDFDIMTPHYLRLKIL
jgi:CRISPR/Cas system CMR subunit Cmr6 (Cas7 group RAMP superfamily)